MTEATAVAKSSNKDELLRIFRHIIPKDNWRLLEVGTGSGHHAVHIAAQIRTLQWVTSDVAACQDRIKKTLKEAKLANVHGPIVFEIGKDEFPKQKLNAIFAAQVLHVISWKQAKSLFKVLGKRLRKGSQVIFYGPFKYDGEFSSERFSQLDSTLRAKDPQTGIRAFEDVLKAMNKVGFKLKKDYSFADSNHLLFFERLEHQKIDENAAKKAGTKPS